MQTGALNRMEQSLAADAASLNRLKYQAGQATPAAIRETARQFESMFMRELLKSMREATMKSGLLDSPQENLGTDLLDQQFAVQMSGQPGGLAEVIARQLMQQMNLAEPGPARDAAARPRAPAAPAPDATPALPVPQAARGFVQQHAAAARLVERSSGLPASYLLGQAGHESGWGQREIMRADGSTSHNLFGIKATGDWKGQVAEVTTTEYVDGVPKKTVARFRAYDSYAESFQDFARLIGNSPRYAQARQQTGSVQDWAQGLQQAGYATDPNYAAKLSRAINTTLQLQRAQG